MNLVMIPFHDWKKCEMEGFRTRDAHFMQEFDKHSQIEKMLIVDRPLSVAEAILLRRNKRVRDGMLILADRGFSLTQVSPKTYVLDLFVWEILRPLRMRRNWTPAIFGDDRLLSAFERALQTLEIFDQEYNLLISAPFFIPLVRRLSPNTFAFDALDNLTKHAFYRDMPDIDKYYQECLSIADRVYTNSPETAEWLSQTRADTICIPNGVDVLRFDNSKEYPLPDDMSTIPRPIAGYAGKIQEMFDIDMMKKVVTDQPDINFVFIGQELDSKWAKTLWEHPNVWYLGDKSYDSLPAYLNAFDICLIPYHVTRQHGVDPIKFYEYLAMGKPIVTTDVGQVRKFVDYPQVRIANEPDGFSQHIADLVGILAQNGVVEVQAVPRESLWSYKANLIVSNMEKQLV